MTRRGDPPDAPRWDRAHYPTGRTSLEDVVRLLVEELDVEPRTPTWRETIDVSNAVFREHATWG